MKSTGIVRHIDNLGRITLPIELRKSLDMACGDPCGNRGCGQRKIPDHN